MDFLDYMFEFNDDHSTGTIYRYSLFETKAKIPSVVAGYKMTGIGRWAFYCGSEPDRQQAPLEEIELDEGYRFLNHGAFFGCDKLKKLVLPSTLETMYGDPFEGAGAITEIVFPNGNDSFTFDGTKLTDRSGKVYYTVEAK